MKENIAHGQQDVRYDPNVVSLLPPRLRGSPEQSVDGVLTCEGLIILILKVRVKLPNAEKSLSATSIMLYIK